MPKVTVGRCWLRLNNFIARNRNTPAIINCGIKTINNLDSSDDCNNNIIPL